MFTPYIHVRYLCADIKPNEDEVTNKILEKAKELAEKRDLGALEPPTVNGMLAGVSNAPTMLAGASNAPTMLRSRRQ